jgi:hypothetical protein
MGQHLEERFIVLKKSDVEKYLDNRIKSLLRKIREQIYEGRRSDNKVENSYVVVNLDEPYAQYVINLVMGMPLASTSQLPSGYKVWYDNSTDTVWIKGFGWTSAEPFYEQDLDALEQAIGYARTMAESKWWRSIDARTE